MLQETNSIEKLRLNTLLKTIPLIILTFLFFFARIYV